MVFFFNKESLLGVFAEFVSLLGLQQFYRYQFNIRFKEFCHALYD